MKKSLSLLLAIALVFTMAASAFAADTAATGDASATATSATYTTQEKYDQLVAAGIFEGDADGLPHLDAKMTRAQFAKILTKVFGLKENADASKVYGDLDGAGWAAGFIGAVTAAKYMEGDAGKFMPSADVTTEQLATVLVRTMGGKPVAGAKVAGTSDWAAGYVQAALDAKLIPAAADYTKAALRGALVEAGYAAYEVVNKPTPTPTPSATPTPTPAAKITSVSSVDNVTIAVNYDSVSKAVYSDFAVKDAAGAAVAVSAAVAKNGGKTVVLTTAAQTPGASYTVTVGGVSYSIVAKPADTTAPTLSAASAVTGSIVRASFATTDIDQDTLVAANFKIDNSVTVNSVALDTESMAQAANAGTTIVLLNTSALKESTVYTLITNGIKDLKGNVAATDASKLTFAGKNADTTAPDSPVVSNNNGYKLDVLITEGTQLDVATATNVANYAIDGGVTISKAEIKYNELGAAGRHVVTLYTSEQSATKVYTLTVSNLKDIAGNVMAAAKTTTFAGVTKPTNNSVTGAVGLSGGKKVRVNFGYATNDTALQVANYSINNNLAIRSAEYLKNTDGTLDKSVVILTTDPQAVSTVYTITIKAAVQNELGQGLTADNTQTFAGQPADTSFAGISGATPVSKTSVEVKFAEAVEVASATNLLNYSINGGLGYPTAVSMKANTDDTVVLTTVTQSAGTGYTITINNIKDLADPANTITANSTVQFAGIGDVVTNVKLVSVTPVNNAQIKVVFNQAVNTTAPLSANDFTLTSSDSTEPAFTNTTDWTVTAPAGADADYVVLNLVGKTLRPASVYTLTLVNGTTPITGSVNGKPIAAAADVTKTFGGTSVTKGNIGITGVSALNNRQIAIMFNNDLTAAGGANDVEVYTTSDLSGTAVAKGTPVIDVDTKSKVVVTLDANLNNTTIYYLKLVTPGAYTNSVYGTVVKTAAAGANYAQFATGSLANYTAAHIKVSGAAMIDKNTLDVVINSDVTGASTTNSDYTISNASGAIANAVTKVAIKGANYPQVGKNIIRLTLNAALVTGNSNEVYTVAVANNASLTAVGTSLNGSSSTTDELKTSFAKVTTAVTKPAIIGVTPVADNKIQVTFNKVVYQSAGTILTTANKLVIQNKTTGGTPFYPTAITAANVASPDGKSFIVTAPANFVSGQQYAIAIANLAVVTSDDDVTAATTSTTNTGTLDNTFVFGGGSGAAPTVTVANLGFRNDTTKQISSTATIALGTYTKIEVVTAASAPDASAAAEYTFDNSAATGAQLTLNTWTNFSTVAGGAATAAGDTVYYRVIDLAGNKSAWTADGVVPAALANATLTSALDAGATSGNYTYADAANGGGNDTLTIAGAAFTVSGTLTITGFTTSPVTQAVTASTATPAINVGDNTDSAVAKSITIVFTNADGNASANTTLTVTDN